jgi:hypothetical protein
MNDLMQRLRDENPVSVCSPPSIDDVWRKLDAGAGSPPTRRPEWPIVALGAIPAVAIVVVAIVALRSGPSASPARHGISGRVVVHYTATSVRVSSAKKTTRVRWEVWVSGSLTHVEFFRNGVLAGEIASTPTRIQEYLPPPRGNVIATGAPPKGPAVCNALLTICGLRGVDPVALVRQRVRSGALRAGGTTVRGGRRYQVLQGNPGDVGVTVLVDPSTSIPVEIVTRTPLAGRGRAFVFTTTTISGYERLPLTAKSEAFLQLRDHRGAPAVCRVFEFDNSLGNC